MFREFIYRFNVFSIISISALMFSALFAYALQNLAKELGFSIVAASVVERKITCR